VSTPGFNVAINVIAVKLLFVKILKVAFAIKNCIPDARVKLANCPVVLIPTPPFLTRLTIILYIIINNIIYNNK